MGQGDIAPKPNTEESRSSFPSHLIPFACYQQQQALQALGYLPTPDSSTPNTEAKPLIIFGHSFGAMVRVHVSRCLFVCWCLRMRYGAHSQINTRTQRLWSKTRPHLINQQNLQCIRTQNSLPSTSPA